MKCCKRIGAWIVTLAMLLSMMAVSGITASAIEGGGKGTGSIKAWGCDMSYYNVGGNTLDYSMVDFNLMLADGCEYVILRIGYEGSASRTNVLDPSFVGLYNRARAAGMGVGLYFYSLATTYNGAVEDAQWVMNIIESNDMYFEYPIYYDVEDSSQTSLGSSAMTNLCLGWCETLEAAGYFGGIYGGQTQVMNKLSSNFLSRYDTWIAYYRRIDTGTQYDPANPTTATSGFSTAYGMWQYKCYNDTWTPSYEGSYWKDSIGYPLDCNVSYKDYPTIMSTYGWNNCGTSTTTATTAEKLGTYRVTASSLNVRAGTSTSYEILGAMATNELAVVTELSNGWGKLTTSSGIEGWASIVTYGDYIGVDALGYEKASMSESLSYHVNGDGSITLTNTSTSDLGVMDFYMPFMIGTATTPYFNVKVTPVSGNGYYFGLTQYGSGYFMMRDCNSSDQLVQENSAPYMTGTEALEINVKEWWQPTEGYRIDNVRFYVAPSSSITINYMYFAEDAGVVTDSSYNTVLGEDVDTNIDNINLMDPATLSISDTTKSGGYSYSNGVLEVVANTDRGYDVVFDVNASFDLNTYKRLLVSIDARTKFNITLVVTNANGEGTVSLVNDFYPMFTSTYPSDGFLPAFTSSAGLDLYNYYSYNKVIPADGISTVKQVKISLGAAGVAYFSAVQLAEDDALEMVYDGVTKADSSEAITLDSDVYTVASGVLSDVSVGTTVAGMLSNVTSHYTLTVYENGMAVSTTTIAKTGQVVKITYGTTEVASYVVAVTGDVDGDGAQSSADVRAILASMLDTALSGAPMTAADVDNSNAVDTSDARMLLCMMAV